MDQPFQVQTVDGLFYLKHVATTRISYACGNCSYQIMTYGDKTHQKSKVAPEIGKCSTVQTEMQEPTEL